MINKLTEEDIKIFLDAALSTFVGTQIGPKTNDLIRELSKKIIRDNMEAQDILYDQYRAKAVPGPDAYVFEYQKPDKEPAPWLTNVVGMVPNPILYCGRRMGKTHAMKNMVAAMQGIGSPIQTNPPGGSQNATVAPTKTQLDGTEFNSGDVIEPVNPCGVGPCEIMSWDGDKKEYGIKEVLSGRRYLASWAQGWKLVSRASGQVPSTKAEFDGTEFKVGDIVKSALTTNSAFYEVAAYHAFAMAYVLVELPASIGSYPFRIFNPDQWVYVSTPGPQGQTTFNIGSGSGNVKTNFDGTEFNPGDVIKNLNTLEYWEVLSYDASNNFYRLSNCIDGRGEGAFDPQIWESNFLNLASKNKPADPDAILGIPTYHNDNLNKKSEYKPCTCPINVLMGQGYKCGAITKYKGGLA